MLEWLGLSAVSPAALWGTLLVASPIVIHLLNKRRFRTIDWAAMEFLLEAQRRNRRRIRLEDLILLLLRCLAVILLALVVARLLLSPRALGPALPRVRYERILLLDDSPSMDVRHGTRTLFEEAKAALVSRMRAVARQNSGDTVTLVVTSAPDRPLLAGWIVTPRTVEEGVQLVENLRVSDKAAALDAALLAVEKITAEQRGAVNRLLTVLTDFRRRDWMPPPGAAWERSVPGVLKRVAERTEGVTVLHLEQVTDTANATVEDVRVPQGLVVAGRAATFDVVVRNPSELDADDVRVTFTAGDAVPRTATIPRIRAGDAETLSFDFTFAEPGPARVSAEIGPDALLRDNVRYLAADVQPGIRVLIVDGEPSHARGESEAFYLARALAPGGRVSSGNLVKVVTEGQFAETVLDPYHAVFLLNVYRVNEERRDALDAWISAGGGLVVFLGDQVDAAAYNRDLYDDGRGWFPLRLELPAGDEREQSWLSFGEPKVNHPVFRIFQGARNPFLQRVKTFRYWSAVLPDATGTNRQATVLMTFTNPEESPAAVERRHGEGRVLVFTTSADAEWTSWPADESYIVTALELVRDLGRSDARETGVAVGEPIRLALDPGRFGGQVTVFTPREGETVVQQPVPDEAAQRLGVTVEETGHKGFYQVAAPRHDGASETFLFAANIDPTEGDLAPADKGALRARLGEAKVRFAGLNGDDSGKAEPDGKVELWRPLLVLLLLVLGAEQVLGWWFGAKR